MKSHVSQHFDNRAATYNQKGIWVKDKDVMNKTIDFLNFAARRN